MKLKTATLLAAVGFSLRIIPGILYNLYSFGIYEASNSIFNLFDIMFLMSSILIFIFFYTLHRSQNNR